MTDVVTAVPGERMLVGQGWSLCAEGVEMLGAYGWRALIGVRRHLKLLVTGTGQAEQLQVEAWTGEPDQSDGVAVIDAGDDLLQVARVPLCSCGDRRCGNVGVQLHKHVAGSELPALADLLRDLPWARTVPTQSNVLRGNGLAAIDRQGTDPAWPGSYLYSPLTGTSWHPPR